MRMMRCRRSVLLFALLVAVSAGYFTRPFVLGLSFVVRAADLHGLVHSVAAIGDFQQWLAEAGLELNSVHAPIADSFASGIGPL